MFWQQDTSEETFQIPDNMLDLRFQIRCEKLPVQHMRQLSQQLLAAAPRLREQTGFAIHEIHMAGSQNGWERPDTFLTPSRRTRLAIRTPTEQIDYLLDRLQGKTLWLDDAAIQIGEARRFPLVAESTLLARRVICQDEDENRFMEASVTALQAQGIKVRKALCGRLAPLITESGEAVNTRSLLLADLSKAESIQLQQAGLGSHQLLGCGIFIPHKGIEAVHKPQGE